MEKVQIKDGMLVTDEVFEASRVAIDARCQGDGLGAVAHDLADFEPVLVRRARDACESVAGRLALAGAPSEVVQGVFDDLYQVVLTAIDATRRGQYEYWKDMMTVAA